MKAKELTGIEAIAENIIKPEIQRRCLIIKADIEQQAAKAHEQFIKNRYEEKKLKPPQ